MPSATRPAVAEVAGIDRDKKRFKKAQQTLASLWLVKQTDGGQRLAVDGLTRELARARLAQDPRHKPYCQRFILRFQKYSGVHKHPTPADLNALEAEKDNVLAAMDLAFETERWLSVMTIGDAVEEFLDVRGYWDEAIRRGDQALLAAGKMKSSAAAAQFAANVALIRMNRGEHEQAFQTYQGALTSLRQLGDDKNVAICLIQLGNLAYHRKDMDEAEKLYLESIEISEKLGYQNGIGQASHQLGVIAQERGDLDKAQSLYEGSIKIFTRMGDQPHIAVAKGNLGRIAQAQNKLLTARQLYEESREMNRRLGDQLGMAMSLGQLGMLAEEEGDKDEAARLFGDALVIFEKLKSPEADRARRGLERVKGKSS